MDKKMFCMLAQKYHDKMYKTAYQVVRNDADAQDAVSEGVLRAFINRNNIKNQNKFAPWICHIVRNEAVNIVRDREREAECWKQIAPSMQAGDTQKKALDIAMKGLPADCRDEMFLFYYHEFSLKEIAKKQNIPLGTAKSKIHRGRKLLKKRFSEILDAAPLEEPSLPLL